MADTDGPAPVVLSLRDRIRMTKVTEMVVQSQWMTMKVKKSQNEVEGIEQHASLSEESQPAKEVVIA